MHMLFHSRPTESTLLNQSNLQPLTANKNMVSAWLKAASWVQAIREDHCDL